MLCSHTPVVGCCLSCRVWAPPELAPSLGGAHGVIHGWCLHCCHLELSEWWAAGIPGHGLLSVNEIAWDPYLDLLAPRCAHPPCPSSL